MTKIRKLTALLLLLGLACNCACASRKAGLVAYYPLDEGAGTVTNDKSGNVCDGKIIGGAEWATGDFGSALSFDGTDDYVDCGVESALQIGSTGSLLLWFKPEEVPQGGLLGWTAGNDEHARRLVAAIDPFSPNGNRRGTNKGLGVYVSDGTDTWPAHESRLHPGYMPMADEWLFLAVTLDGREVNFYRDGVHVYSRFQSHNPDTTNIPLWIGRSLGVGGNSGYFKGLINEVRIYDRPLSGREVYKLYMKDASGHGKDTNSFGSIGISPLANPKAGKIFADLDYRGLLVSERNAQITARLLDNDGAEVSRVAVRITPAWGRAEAVFDVASLPAGEYTIRATARKGKPASAAVNWRGREPGWENVNVLNNFCWELLNVAEATRSAEQFTFTNPQKGWVYFNSEVDGHLTLSVGAAQPSLIHEPGKGARQEAMRWMQKGDYQVSMAGSGDVKSLVVRAVPTLAYTHYPHVGPGAGEDEEFLQTKVLSSVNTLITGDYDVNREFRKKWAEKMGRRSVEVRYSRSVLARQMEDAEVKQQIHDFMATAGMTNSDFHGVILDEFDPGNDTMAGIKCYYDQWNEVSRDMMGDQKYAGRMIIPYICYDMYSFQKSTEFVKNFRDLGSLMAWEVYLHEQETESGAWVYLNEALSKMAAEYERAVPGVTNNIIITLSYLNREFWNPQVDFNVYMDMQMQYLATRPEFFGLAGIDEYASHYATEEYIRWATRLYRHYGLEGNTERLSQDPYILAHLSNGDFRGGTDSWSLKAAQRGSMGLKTHNGYGVLQELYPYREFTQTDLMWMRRSDEKPNVLSQKITDLEPGRTYIMSMKTGDYQDLINGTSVEKQHAVSIDIENVEMINDWYRNEKYGSPNATMYKAKTWRTVGPFNGENQYCINVHTRVFRAKGRTAKLVISDWKQKDQPGAPAGEELVLNNIEVKPYFSP